ncbi:MAG: hypothetical protein J5808_06165 [Paludibacteraceae bacterium]|nr:hypothetical protein [Paludibacteraceae bacterium]
MKTKFILALMPGLLLALAACEETETLDPFVEDNFADGKEQSDTSVAESGAIDGRGYVDLGLSSGTLWATCNVGAESPEEYGDYFAWGETSPKLDYSWETYKYGDVYEQPTKYCTKNSDGKDGFVDDKAMLDAYDDAATVNWGYDWRMPTVDEIEELNSECSSTWTSQNGKIGRLFTGPNGNTLFLPAAGYFAKTSLYNVGYGGSCWSSMLAVGGPWSAYYYYWDSTEKAVIRNSRVCGRPVRPVVATFNPSPAYLMLDISERTFWGSGGSFSVQVVANKEWTVTCDQPWVALSVASGSGPGSFSVQVAANESGSADHAVIAVTTVTGNATKTVSVSRAANRLPNGTLSNHDYVDLGLPSGTLWATCNVGADSPEEYGDYFAWGETEPKSNYSLFDLKYCTYNAIERKTTFSKYTGNDGKSLLDAEDDAATYNWGSDWRMPTKAEFEELYSECARVWAIRDGKDGHLFTGSNGNVLYLPIAGSYNGASRGGEDDGVYWSSSLSLGWPDCAYYFGGDVYLCIGGYWQRSLGLSVRPVVKR